MKTTIDIPDALYRRAKIRAVERGKSLKQLVVESIELALNAPTAASPGEDPMFEANEFGFPVLRNREGTVVTEELINRIREAEGI